MVLQVTLSLHVSQLLNEANDFTTAQLATETDTARIVHGRRTFSRTTALEGEMDVVEALVYQNETDIRAEEFARGWITITTLQSNIDSEATDSCKCRHCYRTTSTQKLLDSFRCSTQIYLHQLQLNRIVQLASRQVYVQMLTQTLQALQLTQPTWRMK